MAIDSKNLLVWVKAMSRGQALPLDSSEVYASLAEAEHYASTSAIAYPGQTIKALLEDGKYHNYTLQPSESGYVLEEVGALNASDLKQFVQVVNALPESGQSEGVLYILKTTVDEVDSYTDGYVYVGGDWKHVFWDVTADIDAKANINNPIFTGTIKLETGEDEEGNKTYDEVALKSYVDGLLANMVSDVPGVLSDDQTEITDLKNGQMFRVATAGTYFGHACEAGDLVLVINSEAENDVDKVMVIQANIDGAVTSTAAAATVGEIVVFDSVTGKVIKGSGVQIASLNDAIAKAHEHANATQLATYDKTQTELLAAAKTEAEGLVAAHETAVNTALDAKANTTDVEASLKTITDNLNTKISVTDAETKIATAKQEAITDAEGKIATAKQEAITDAEGKIATAKGEAISAANTALEARVGNIPAETTIQSYIDTAVGSGGTASAEAIATAKQEAITTSNTYTDTQINAALTVVEF